MVLSLALHRRYVAAGSGRILVKLTPLSLASCILVPPAAVALHYLPHSCPNSTRTCTSSPLSLHSLCLDHLENPRPSPSISAVRSCWTHSC